MDKWIDPVMNGGICVLLSISHMCCPHLSRNKVKHTSQKKNMEEQHLLVSPRIVEIPLGGLSKGVFLGESVHQQVGAASANTECSFR